MHFVRGLYNLKAQDHHCVLTIGNFDGVHLGHAKVIKALVAKARELKCPSVVMVFEPQPQELFRPEQSPARLTRLRDKYVLLQRLGVDKLVCVKFNTRFAAMTAQDFVKQIIVDKLQVKHLIIGDDFKFGYRRQGDFSMLQSAGKQYGFSVSDTQSYKLEDCRISSTAIRQALQNNQLADAEQMLGRKYAIIGRVVHGDKRGRKLGFPTANVLLKRLVSPAQGVYVVQVNIDEKTEYGVANIGSRPTVNGIRQQLEVHLFNFNKPLYGQTLEVVLLHHIRDEQQFDSLEQLQQQIEIDSQAAKTYLQNNHFTK